MEIRILHRQGRSIKQIALELGISRNTVRKYLRTDAAPSYGPRVSRPSKLEPFKQYIADRIAAALPHWIPGSVMIREMRERGYQGGITILREYLAKLKPRASEDPLVRFETPAGKQMQVDWGAFRLGETRISAFVATLGWSRCSYVEFVANEQFETLRHCHENAFDYFGGVPSEVLYDNMRTVVIKRNEYGNGLHRFHPGLRDLAHQYGFTPRLCRPYRAKTKGKVERFICYLRYSFFHPTVSLYQQQGKALDLDLLNVAVGRWLYEVGNARLHKTTGAVPAQRLQVERHALLSLPPCYPKAQPIAGSDRSFDACYAKESLQHSLSVYQAVLEGVTT